MTRREDNTVLSVIHPVCCGLDVHKKKIVACLLLEEEGSEQCMIKEFGTFTDDIKNMKEWLFEHEVR